MSDTKAISYRLVMSGLIILLLSMSQYATKSQTRFSLPREIVGLAVGMSRADAQKRLEQIGEFERDDRKQQQVWRLKDDPRYSHIIIGFDANEQVRYLTAFVDKSKARVLFSDIGDITKSKQEIVKPHYKYTWEVPATDGKPSYLVVAYGNEPELLSSCSLSRVIVNAETEKEDE